MTLNAERVEQYLDGGTVAVAGDIVVNGTEYDRIIVDRRLGSETHGRVTLRQRIAQGEEETHDVPSHLLGDVARAIVEAIADDVDIDTPEAFIVGEAERIKRGAIDYV